MADTNVDIHKLKSSLSDEQRSLLERRLTGKRTATPKKDVISRRKQKSPASLSFAQQRLWFLDRLDPGKPLYNIPLRFDMAGKLKVETLHAVLKQIIARHEVLRTRFIEVEGQVMQIISDEAEVELPIIDLSALDEASRRTAETREARSEAARPFDLSRTPLFRFSLLKLNEREHVLLVNMHHIISDGWSLIVLLEELDALYTGGKLDELPIQYADYAEWQKQYLETGALQQQLNYWKQHLAGAPPVLELPADRPRPPVQSSEGSLFTFVVPAAVLAALKELSRRHSVTLFMSSLAAFEILLYRYSGQTDMLLGTPIANRNRLETEKLIGFFVNTLILRARIQPEASYEELVRQQKEEALGAYARQDLPFEKLVEEIQPERSLTYSPLFQVMFALRNNKINVLKLPELDITIEEIDSGTSQFDLTFTGSDEQRGLACTVSYNTDLFDERTMERMASHFTRLLESIVADPACHLIDLHLLTDAERHQLIWQWNDTARPFSSNHSIQELFEKQASLYPDEVAVSEEQYQLSYGELNRRANTVARYLGDLGVGGEAVVGICLGRSIETVISMLAVLKAGAAYLPLDPDYPAHRIMLLLEDAAVNVVITREDIEQTLPEHQGHTLRIDRLWEQLSSYSRDNLSFRSEPDALAYVMYTSGTTGKPKGVCVSHRSVIWVTESMDGTDLERGKVIAHSSNPCFDLTTFEVWGGLLHGARVEITSKQIVINAERLEEYLRERRIDVMYLTAALFAQLASQRAGAFSTLDCLIYGGEAMDAKWVRTVQLGGSPKRIMHEYGPTETTVSSSFLIVGEVKEGTKSVTMGPTMSNTQSYNLDAKLEPVPVGVSGELYIGGEGVARGYLGRPDLTAEKFIPNPHTHSCGMRMYTTGDIVRMRAEGEIEYVGRKDEQVKIRGHRIEMGEIERAVVEQEGVKDCVAVVKEDEQIGKRIVCYVVERERDGISRDVLIQKLRERLPAYMVPNWFEIIDEIPLTGNGKVDKRKLPEPQWGRIDDNVELVEPSTLIEEIVAGIWKELLKLENVGVNDNFFAAGGHSLLATRVVTRIRSTLGVDLPLRSFFLAPTVAGLADLIQAEILSQAVLLSPANE